MKCPNCAHTNSKVIDSRHADEVDSIRRRRECESCNTRFTTFERIEFTPLVVVKKDGTRQKFSREKVLDGLIRACEKRPVALSELERLVESVIANLRNLNNNEVTSNQIGEAVMRELMTLDQVAYVRFASVYKEFKDIDQLKEVLINLTTNSDSHEH